jgi:gamma-glutamyl hercynylcysteine S-oxide hydrolase
MCRHLAYLGPPTSLQSLLIDPPHGLYRQSWAPRLQRYGTVNADGFGVGWYADDDPVPARYRRGIPIWGDPSLPDVARVTRSGAVLAAVRSATVGMATGESAAAPFASGAWLFSHNGILDGWPGGDWLKSVRDEALGGVLPVMEAMTDSAYLWAMVVGRLRAGLGLGAALAATIEAIRAAGGRGRLNFLATDGRLIAATSYGDTLFYRADARSVTVASEPSDDSPGWTEVADGQLLTAIRGKVDIRPLFEDAEEDVPKGTLSEGIMLK